MFFICWDARTRTGVVCHIRRAPGVGSQEAQAVVVIEGEPASAWLEGPFVPDALVAGVVAAPVEPFRHWSFQLQCTGVAGSGPLGFLAAQRGGDTPFGADLRLESDLPVADFAE